MAFANLSGRPNFKLLASAVAEILKGDPKTRELSSPGPPSLFLGGIL